MLLNLTCHVFKHQVFCFSTSRIRPSTQINPVLIPRVRFQQCNYLHCMSYKGFGKLAKAQIKKTTLASRLFYLIIELLDFDGSAGFFQLLLGIRRGILADCG